MNSSFGGDGLLHSYEAVHVGREEVMDGLAKVAVAEEAKAGAKETLVGA